MAQVDDIEQVDRELEAFRARAQDALKSFDRLTELISEFTKTRQAYEAEVGNAAEMADLLKNRLNEIDQNWQQLKSEVDEARELLSRSEVEREGRWVQYNKDNKKAQEELEASWQEVQTQLGQVITDLQNDCNQHFAEVNQNLDLQATRLDDIQNAFEQRWTTLEGDHVKTKNGLIAADRNLRNQLEQTVADLRGESEQHLAEVIQGLDSHALRLDGFQDAFIAADRNLQNQLDRMVTDLRGDSEKRFTKLQEDGARMQNDFQAAHGDLRTASWKMVDDLRGEAEGRFSEINKSLARQAARHEETNEAIEARIVEANNRLAGELEASRQEYWKNLGLFEQNDLVTERRIDTLQSIIWVLIAIILIAVLIIIYATY
jgi:chromosome segregation ATPase